MRWMGDYALLEPAPGGAFDVDINGVAGPRALPRGRPAPSPAHQLGPRRVRPPAARARARSRCASPRSAGGTQVEIVHRGLPADQRGGVRARLAALHRAPRDRGRRRRSGPRSVGALDGACGSRTTAQSPSMSSSPGTTRERARRAAPEPRAVARAQVDRQPRAVDRAQLEVTARDRRLGHHDVAAAAAPDDDRSPRPGAPGRGGGHPRRAPARPVRRRRVTSRPARDSSATSTLSSFADRARSTRPRRCSKVSTLR